VGRPVRGRPRRPQLSGLYSAEAWNATHPIGTAVRFWPVYPPIDRLPTVDTVAAAEG